jgi:hypothetical protein
MIPQLKQTLQEFTIEENNQKLAVRTASLGNCGKIFQTV